jgi:hypothetical protein
LRGIARQTEYAVRWKATELQQLLTAEEERVFSAEHCARMRARFGEMMVGLAKLQKPGEAAQVSSAPEVSPASQIRAAAR